MVGAHVRQYTDAQAENLSIFLESKFEMVDRIAAVNRGSNVLAARFRPLDRTAKLHRQPRYQAFLAVDI